MAASWSAYLDLLRGLTKTLGQLTGVELEKAKAVGRGDILTVEECMKREQALSLSLRSAEQKRDRMVRELGMEGVPLRNIMDHCPPEYDLETKEVAGALRDQYDIFQAASTAARDALECNLRVIEQAMKAAGAAPPAGGASPAAPGGDAPAHTDFRA